MVTVDVDGSLEDSTSGIVGSVVDSEDEVPAKLLESSFNILDFLAFIK